LEAAMNKEIENIFEEFMRERGNVPRYAQFLAEENPEFLIKLSEIRRLYRGQGILSEKFKELILIATNAIRLSESAVESHIKTAMKMGATKQEIIEVGLAGVWPIGGLTSLNVILYALMKILKSDEKR
jgi:AhpD family alkylhydroperoxidase